MKKGPEMDLKEKPKKLMNNIAYYEY